MRRAYAPGLQIAVAAILILGVAAIATAIILGNTRSDAIADAESAVGDIAAILAENTRQSVQSVDFVLDDLIASLSQAAIEDSESFRRTIATKEQHDAIVARLDRWSEVEVIGVVDHDGEMILSTRGWPTPSINVAGRDPFDFLKDNRYRRLFVGVPIRNHADGRWTVYFSRRVESRNGAFLGTISIGVPPEFFLQISNGISEVAETSARLLREDGVIYVTNPASEGLLGESAQEAPAWFAAAAAGGGSFRDATDGDSARIVAVRPVAGYPLVVDVSVSEASVLGLWRERAAPIAAISAALALGITGLVALLLLQFHAALERQALLRDREERLDRESQQRRMADSRLAAAVTHMRQGLAVFDDKNRLVTSNRNYAEMYGIRPEQLQPGMPFADVLRLRTENGTCAQCPSHGLPGAGDGQSHVTEVEQLADGRFVSSSWQTIPGGGWLVTHEDVTDREKAATHLAYLARHDALTGLANRTLLIERLGALSRNGARVAGSGLLLVDLAGFKSVNERFGHGVGDKLLVDVAARLGSIVRAGDTLARLGADEFAILRCPDEGDLPTLSEFADQVLVGLLSPFPIERHVLNIGASIGTTEMADGPMEPHSVLSRADLALNRARSDGLNRVVAFNRSMEIDIAYRRDLLAGLDSALEEGQLQVHYQPIVDARTGSALAMEALVRWRHPQLGDIAPSVLVSLAEGSGHIHRLGELVLSHACKTAMGWPSDVKLAVNISAIQVAHGDLPSTIRRCLGEAGLPPSRLEVEITESVLLPNDEHVRSVLRELRLMGIEIVLDDFGTGYASLSNLHDFGVDKIKVDRSFIAHLGDHHGCAAIVRASAMIADAFRVVVTAEGVETQEQCTLLREMGITQLQGYLFGRPAPADRWFFEDRKAVARGSQRSPAGSR